LSNPALAGDFDLSFDEKHRLMVPVELRKLLNLNEDKGLFAVLGQNRKLWLYSQAYYEELADKTDPGVMIPTPQEQEFERFNFGLASRLPLDKQGRIRIPDKTLRLVGLDTEVTLVAARRRLELWNRSEWMVERERLWQECSRIINDNYQMRQVSAS
jgi:division/cell wall cluster transcriptional repressor MraZ